MIDQNLSMGKGGVLHGELASVRYGVAGAPVVAGFIGGLGGRDIGPGEFREMISVLEQAVADGETPPPRLLFSAEELRHVRKLQASAHVEREEIHRQERDETERDDT